MYWFIFQNEEVTALKIKNNPFAKGFQNKPPSQSPNPLVIQDCQFIDRLSSQNNHLFLEMNQENQPQNHQSFGDNFGQPDLFNLSSQIQFQSHLPPACAYNVSPSSFNSKTESSKFSSAENGKPQFQSKWKNEFSNSVQQNFPVTSLASGRIIFF